jgi:hypothetical protein
MAARIAALNASGASLRAICAALTEEGHRTKRGGSTWHPNPPSQQNVTQATKAAQAAISAALSTTNGYIDQANSQVTTAFGYAAQAYQAGNCGSAPTAPSPQSHIG